MVEGLVARRTRNTIDKLIKIMIPSLSLMSTISLWRRIALLLYTQLFNLYDIQTRSFCQSTFYQFLIFVIPMLSSRNGYHRANLMHERSHSFPAFLTFTHTFGGIGHGLRSQKIVAGTMMCLNGVRIIWTAEATLQQSMGKVSFTHIPILS